MVESLINLQYAGKILLKLDFKLSLLLKYGLLNMAVSDPTYFIEI